MICHTVIHNDGALRPMNACRLETKALSKTTVNTNTDEATVTRVRGEGCHAFAMVAFVGVRCM